MRYTLSSAPRYILPASAETIMAFLVAFMLIEMLSGVSDRLETLVYFSLLTLFDPFEIIANSARAWSAFAVLAVVGLVLYAAGIYIFTKKDLPL